MILRDLAADDAAVLQDLINQHPFKRYRHHRYLSRRQQNAVLQSEINRVRQSPNSICVVTGDTIGDAVLIAARELPWESHFFGVRMGGIEHVLRRSQTTEALTAAIDETLSRFRQAAVEHVACRVDVADHALQYVLEERGFRLMDAMVTYISHPRRPPPRPIKRVGLVRPFRESDTEQILHVTRAAYQGYRGRFQLDPNLPAQKSDAFYLEWARACCSGAMADRIFVAEDSQRRLIGWASVRRAEPVSTVAGAAISVGSLGACRADSPGAYGALICAAATENHAAGVLTEAMTQNANFAMVRVLEAVGAQYARAEYTFHAWLDAR